MDSALPHLRHNISPSRSKIAEDLENLAKQQEILAAEMKKYLAEDRSRAALMMDGDMKFVVFILGSRVNYILYFFELFYFFIHWVN